MSEGLCLVGLICEVAGGSARLPDLYCLGYRGAAISQTRILPSALLVQIVSQKGDEA